MLELFQASAEASVTDVAPVNSFVEKATKGEIPELLPAGTHFDTVLANALYFKGFWEQTFDKSSTAPKLFHAPAGDRSVHMMKGSFEKMRVRERGGWDRRA